MQKGYSLSNEYPFCIHCPLKYIDADMIPAIWRLFRYRGLDIFGFLYILLFAAISLGMIYGIDFIYRTVKKRGK
ncbi:MAG: hypothetical protein ABI663_13205 [Chryseolinea sp.]